MKAFSFIEKNRKTSFLIGILCLLTINYKAHAYHIKGQIKGYSPKWSNKIYLAAINSLSDFQAISKGMIINKTTLDTDGNFVFEGNNLPNENLFYRIYLTQTQEGQYITGEDQNFIHLLLNNKSHVEIHSDLITAPFYYASVSGSPYSNYFGDFYKEVFHLSEQNFNNPYSATSKTQQKFDELVRASVKKYSNPYYTVFVFGHLDFKKWYRLDKTFVRNAIDDLKRKLPDQNIYLVELRDKYQLLEFESSNYKDYLKEQYLLALASLSVFLVAIVIYLSVRLHGSSKIKKWTDNNSAEVSLTQKESEIAKLIVEGKTNKEISGTLFIETSTVKTHISNIYQKLNISNRAELIERLKNQ